MGKFHNANPIKGNGSKIAIQRAGGQIILYSSSQEEKNLLNESHE